MKFFEENINNLEKKDPLLADALKCLPDSSSVKVFPTKKGLPTIRFKGLTLHSSIDPEKEAKDWAEGYEPYPLVIVAGFGLGYHIQELLKREGINQIFVVEPNLHILKDALKLTDLRDVLEEATILWKTDAKEIIEDLGKIDAEYNFEILKHLPSIRANNSFFQEFFGRMETKRRLKDFRLKIMVIYPIYGGSLPVAQFCTRALQHLGHQVEIFDGSQYHSPYQSIETITDNQIHIAQLRGLFTNFLSEAIVAKALRIEPDLILALAQAPLHEGVLRRFKKFGIPTAFWFVEDFRLFDYWSKVAPYYDYFFCIQKDGFFEKLKGAHVENYHYLPLACDPEIHRPLQLTVQEYKEYGSPISFVGAGYHNRRNFLQGLLDMDIKIWGTEWGNSLPLAKYVQRNGARIPTEEIVKIFNATTLNINLHSSACHPGVNPDGDFVNPRTFEIAGCGAFQLVDRRSLMPELFQVGEELICFSNLKDIKEKIKYYLKNGEERKEIARKTRQRVLCKHTYQHRMREMLEVVFQKEYKAFELKRAKKVKAEDLWGKAEGDEELMEFLKKFFPDEEEITLEKMADKIKQGKGKLSEVESILIFLNEFKKDVKSAYLRVNHEKGSYS